MSIQCTYTYKNYIVDDFHDNKSWMKPVSYCVLELNDFKEMDNLLMLQQRSQMTHSITGCWIMSKKNLMRRIFSKTLSEILAFVLSYTFRLLFLLLLFLLPRYTMVHCYRLIKRITLTVVEVYSLLQPTQQITPIWPIKY